MASTKSTHREAFIIRHVEDISDAIDLVLDASMGLKLILQNFYEGRIGWLSSDE